MDTREFVTTHGITADVAPADSNPNMAGDNWSASANHWLVTLRMGRKRMQVPYSTGAALGAPDATDVLDTLASDASSIWNARDFEDWAGDYGYDTDSRQAYRTWQLTSRQAKRLQQFLGVELHRTLIEDVERL